VLEKVENCVANCSVQLANRCKLNVSLHKTQICMLHVSILEITSLSPYLYDDYAYS